MMSTRVTPKFRKMMNKMTMKIKMTKKDLPNDQRRGARKMKQGDTFQG